MKVNRGKGKRRGNARGDNSGVTAISADSVPVYNYGEWSGGRERFADSPLIVLFLINDVRL